MVRVGGIIEVNRSQDYLTNRRSNLGEFSHSYLNVFVQERPVFVSVLYFNPCLSFRHVRSFPDVVTNLCPMEESEKEIINEAKVS